MYTLKQPCINKKIYQKLFRVKMAARKKKNSFRKKSNMTKIWKTTFPKEIAHELMLKVEEHEYIYIFE